MSVFMCQMQFDTGEGMEGEKKKEQVPVISVKSNTLTGLTEMKLRDY